MKANHSFDQGYRQIGWNGIVFSVPADWEVIVNGPKHILVEHDFRQILEIRWERSGPQTAEVAVNRITKSVSKISGTEATRVELQKPFCQLKKLKNAKGLSWGNDQQLSAISWLSENEEILFVCHLHHCSGIAVQPVAKLLESIQLQTAGNHLWSIQDFRLELPQSCNFIDYTLAPGLTRLGFCDNDIHLQFCRLAPASERLATHSLSEILNALQGKIDNSEVIQSNDSIVEHMNSPSTIQQILARLRRKRPFQWGRIWHLSEHNRLLAVTAESIRPININTVHQYCLNYENFPIPEAEAA